MKMSEMFPKNFLAKEDVTNPVVATIRQVSQEEVAGDGGKELKAVIHWQGSNLKPMILNRGNADLLCSLYGDDSVVWHGRQVEIYVDPNVMFAGRRTGGIRLRAPSTNNGIHNHNAPPLWDVSDGKSVMLSQTPEQVHKIISSSGLDPAAFKVKPAGAAREAAKPADQYGFGSAVGASTDGGEIPF